MYYMLWQDVKKYQCISKQDHCVNADESLHITGNMLGMWQYTVLKSLRDCLLPGICYIMVGLHNFRVTFIASGCLNSYMFMSWTMGGIGQGKNTLCKLQ